MTVSTASTHRAVSTLTATRDVLEPALRAAVDSLPPSVRAVVGYHFGWWDAHGVATSAPAGKALRPTLVLLCARAACREHRDALAPALALELVHNFSLVHDDIIDDDLTRRHRPTAWSVFGIPAALLAGNAMLTLAYQVIAQAPQPESRRLACLLGDAVQRLLAGQHDDVAFERRERVTVEEYLSMAARKTAALMACACASGAVTGGADERAVARLTDFGHHLGLAFQAADDLLGIWGDPAVTGKPARSDLRTRKKSLPVAVALASDSDSARELARYYGDREPVDEDATRRMALLVEAAGGREWTERYVDERLRTALSRLRGAGVDGDVATDLEAVARMAVGRKD